MEQITRIIIAIISALIGYLIPKIILYTSYYKRRRRNICQIKFCWWTTGADPDRNPIEVEEEVEISFDFLGSQLLISNEKAPGSISRYKGYGKLVNNHIIGQYASEEGADGTFVLTIASDYSYMYGYWTGQSFDEPEAVGELVFAKDRQSVIKAKRRLSDFRQTLS